MAKLALRQQYGALPYRVGKEGEVEVLVLTSRQTKRWIIPKGWPIKGLKQGKTAAREAYEEAGVRGVVRAKPVGSYIYEKYLDDGGVIVPCEVKVFALRVTRQEKSWPEKTQRQTRWVSPAEAVVLVTDVGLRRLIAGFTPKRAKAKAKG